MTVTVEYGHLIKHRNTAKLSGKAETKRSPKLKLVKGRCQSEIKTHHFSTNWEWKGVFLSAKKLEEVPVGVSEQS